MDWNNPLLQTVVIVIGLFALVAIIGQWTKSKNYRGGRNPRRRKPL